MHEFTTWDIVLNLLRAVPWTLLLSAIAFLGGGVLGLLLLSLRVLYPNSCGRAIRGYVHFFQGTPLLMQLFLTYFGMALLGLDPSPLLAATLCLSWYAAGHFTETWHGCVAAIAKGQWEAASSLALNRYEQLRYVILPQAFRLSIPPTVGLMVQIIKNTSLASVIGFVELTRTGQIISNVTYEPFMVYGWVALMYFALCFPCSWLGRTLEHKYALPR